MAIAKVQKIQLVATSKNKDKILGILQDAGTMEIKEQVNELEIQEAGKKIGDKLQKLELENANIDFAIKTLQPYGKTRGLLEGPLSLSKEEVEKTGKEFEYKNIVEKTITEEEKRSKAKAELDALKSEKELYLNWKSLNIKLEDLKGTENYKVTIGIVKNELLDSLTKSVTSLSSLSQIEIVSKTENSTNILIVFATENEKDIRQALSENKLTEAEFPSKEGSIAENITRIEKQIDTNKTLISESESELKKLSKNLDNLMIAHDYIGWEIEKLEEEVKITNTEYSFVITGWLPEKKIITLDESIATVTKEYVISEIEPEKDEQPPVVIKNNKLLEPFEAVTGIYGLPLYSEIDPTPFLAAYFIVFFGMCLTDAGYGLIMFAVMALALKFVKLESGLKKLVKLLMYGGIVTFFIGALFGGWFGLTTDQVPEFLTYTATNGEKLFIFQKINSLTDPLTVLILALSLGFIQILMGTFMKLIHGITSGTKKERIGSLLDIGPWAVMLTGIGFFILAATNVIPAELSIIGKWWIITAVVLLVLTQGREKKSIIGKLVSGILSLYDLVGYLSDILSYSRLLALGLATAIIGLAVNIIADLLRDMIPIFGYVLMVVVFIGGHIFNLVINALGSFIHSGRLQFVEFFGKFLEGGGAGLKPFSKKTKYIFIKN